MNWITREYGSDHEKIEVLILEEPMENTLVGMISSDLFEEKIAIAFDCQKQLDYDFACLGMMYDGSKPRIYMEQELVGRLKKESDEANLILFHEIGHYIHKDYSKNISDLERERAVQTGCVIEKELFADDFAASYIGKNAVIHGLKILAERMKAKYQSGVDEVSISLALLEIELRIKHQIAK